MRHSCSSVSSLEIDVRALSVVPAPLQHLKCALLERLAPKIKQAQGVSNGATHADGGERALTEINRVRRRPRNLQDGLYRTVTSTGRAPFLVGVLTGRFRMAAMDKLSEQARQIVHSQRQSDHKPLILLLVQIGTSVARHKSAAPVNAWL
jgi:hypothetical protein